MGPGDWSARRRRPWSSSSSATTRATRPSGAPPAAPPARRMPWAWSTPPPPSTGPRPRAAPSATRSTWPWWNTSPSPTRTLGPTRSRRTAMQYSSRVCCPCLALGVRPSSWPERSPATTTACSSAVARSMATLRDSRTSGRCASSPTRRTWASAWALAQTRCPSAASSSPTSWATTSECGMMARTTLARTARTSCRSAPSPRRTPSRNAARSTSPTSSRGAMPRLGSAWRTPPRPSRATRCVGTALWRRARTAIPGARIPPTRVAGTTASSRTRATSAAAALAATLACSWARLPAGSAGHPEAHATSRSIALATRPHAPSIATGIPAWLAPRGASMACASRAGARASSPRV
mmetsp:Transcript_40843/g.117332  ORF Transcript_40843/g.117332 Transcript_40843/m.117332 type:complete len:351 (-) Transcript_40843:1355-2407(-)